MKGVLFRAIWLFALFVVLGVTEGGFFDHPSSFLNQCIDDGQTSEPQNVSRREDGQLCVGNFCWVNDVLETIPNVVRAYTNSTDIKPMYERQFFQHFFSSILGGKDTGESRIATEDEQYAAVMSMMLSQRQTKTSPTTSEMLTAVTISENWIYHPYPPFLHISGIGGEISAQGNYTLQEDSEGLGRVNYYTRNGSIEHRIAWDGRCWGLWKLTLKDKKGKKTAKPASINMPTNTSTDPSLFLNASTTNSSREDVVEEDLDVQYMEKNECKGGHCRNRPIYRSCQNTDMVPTTGWFATGLTSTPFEVSPSICSGSLRLVRFNRRTGSDIQWALLKETDDTKFSKGKSLGYLVFRGTSDTHDILTDISMAKVHWLREDGPSWGVWSSIHSEVRSSISAIRRAVARSGIKRLIVTGHSLGGGYAQEVARMLKSSGKTRRLDMRVVLFGSPPVFARREALECEIPPPGLTAGMMNLFRGVGNPANWREWARKSAGDQCKHSSVWGDSSFQALEAITTNVINRWDLVPRVHLLPYMLTQEGSRGLVPAFTRLLANRIGGYAARFGGYITDALSLPKNFNRTIQSKRRALEQYQQFGDVFMLPPGSLCSFAEVSGTAVVPGSVTSRESEDKKKEKDMGTNAQITDRIRGQWQMPVAVVNSGEEAVAALATDHARYTAAMQSYHLIRNIVEQLCLSEWNVTCDFVSKRFGHMHGGGFNHGQMQLFQRWRQRSKEKERELQEQREMEKERERNMNRQRINHYLEMVHLGRVWEGLGSSDVHQFCTMCYSSTFNNLQNTDEGVSNERDSIMQFIPLSDLPAVLLKVDIDALYPNQNTLSLIPFELGLDWNTIKRSLAHSSLTRVAQSSDAQDRSEEVHEQEDDLPQSAVAEIRTWDNDDSQHSFMIKLLMVPD